MKKITLTVGLYLSMLAAAVSQNADSTQYHDRKLKIDEINLVSSYYVQDGNNASVTGGTGTEWLSNIGNSIDIKLSKWTKRNRQHSLSLDFNIDYYTSASSDNIDPKTISSASRADLHIYPSVAWAMKDAQKHYTVGASVALSHEWDYRSYGGSLSFSKSSKNENTEVSLKLSTFLDQVLLILPVELRGINATTKLPLTTVGSGANIQSRNTFGATLTWSQVINRNLQIAVLLDPSYQDGLLSTPFHRVYYTNSTVTTEKLPTSRLKVPIGIRASYFLGDQVIIRGFYRYYQDNWGMKAHTVNMEVPYKITPFISVSPFYRFSYQTAVSYFAPYQIHQTSDVFYSSDYDLSQFGSHFVGAGFRYAPPNGVMGIKQFSMIELRYGHYYRTTSLLANIVSLQAKFK
jgi:hypothetical protein